MKKFNYFVLWPLSFRTLTPTLSLFLLFLFLGCVPDPLPDNTFYGPPQHFGDGVVKSIVVMKDEGVPEMIGLKISAKVLENLPEEDYNVHFKLPGETEGLAIDHIDLGWNPHGHEPPGVYDIPHFDIHFYMITEEYQSNILDADKAEILPANEFWPQDYFPTEGYVPQMGKHWLNMHADEIQEGGKFTRTFIYGSYDGEFQFYEPMITLDYLKQKGSEQMAIPQPAEFQKTEFYYPTTYSIKYNPLKREYLITMENMLLR